MFTYLFAKVEYRLVSYLKMGSIEIILLVIKKYTLFLPKMQTW